MEAVVQLESKASLPCSQELVRTLFRVKLTKFTLSHHIFFVILPRKFIIITSLPAIIHPSIRVISDNVKCNISNYIYLLSLNFDRDDSARVITLSLQLEYFIETVFLYHTLKYLDVTIKELASNKTHLRRTFMHP